MSNITDDEIIYAAKVSKSAAEASRLLGINYKTYRLKAKALGVFNTNQSGKGTTKRRQRKYKVNNFIFDSVDSIEKAYWLGFIAADGSVVDNTLKFMLKAEDDNHLKRFISFLDSDYPVGYTDSHYKDAEGVNHYFKACYIKITSEHIVGALAKLGIMQNKKYANIDFLANIPVEYQIYFICGLFDGDGSVGVYNNQKVITIANNKLTSTHVYNILYNIGIRAHIRHMHNIDIIYISDTNSIQKFYTIYKSSVTLDRKLKILEST